MTYQTTVTSKGQITIPKVFRDILRFKKSSRVTLKLEANGQNLQIKLAPDFLATARKIKVKRKINVLNAREYMEKNYERT